MSKKHARYSPSTVEKLLLCSCFRHKDMLQASDEGTLLHKAAETGDLTGLDDEQKKVVSTYLTYVANVKAGFGDKPIFHAHERKLELKDLTFGYADDVIICGDVAHIPDLKTGRKPVTPADLGGVPGNVQVRIYCAALMEELPHITQCTGHLVAPRIPHTSHYTFGRDVIESTRKMLEESYDKWDDPFERKPIANEELCPICARAAKCPVLNTTAVLAARSVGLPVPAVFDPGSMVSDADRSKAQAIAQALENWAEQIKKRNLAYVVETGAELPGFKLMNKSTGKRVPRDNSLSACNALLASGYLNQEQLLGTVSLSIPEMAKAAQEIRGTTENEERARLGAILGTLAVEGSATYLQRIKKITDQQLLEG